MTVLLSIKPEFAQKIFDGTKKYEFRKNIFKRKDIKKIIVYASSPVQQVIGEFEIKDILHDDVASVWKVTKQFSGISRQFYNEYFANVNKAFAIEIGTTKKYSSPKTLLYYGLNFVPQSFAYIS
ncbi:MAG: ASCH domain-containing protein [Endomicrobia bacterium]|jgi:predicted transcriptional regulator|nr:ASCH domain-containing protein [Endomicrobiia bacterium]